VSLAPRSASAIGRALSRLIDNPFIEGEHGKTARRIRVFKSRPQRIHADGSRGQIPEQRKDRFEKGRRDLQQGVVRKDAIANCPGHDGRSAPRQAQHARHQHPVEPGRRKRPERKTDHLRRARCFPTPALAQNAQSRFEPERIAVPLGSEGCSGSRGCTLRAASC